MSFFNNEGKSSKMGGVHVSRYTIVPTDLEFSGDFDLFLEGIIEPKILKTTESKAEESLLPF